MGERGDTVLNLHGRLDQPTLASQEREGLREWRICSLEGDSYANIILHAKALNGINRARERRGSVR